MKRKKYLACCVAASMMLGVASPAMVGAAAQEDNVSVNENADVEVADDIETSDVEDSEEIPFLEDEDTVEASADEDTDENLSEYNNTDVDLFSSGEDFTADVSSSDTDEGWTPLTTLINENRILYRYDENEKTLYFKCTEPIAIPDYNYGNRTDWFVDLGADKIAQIEKIVIGDGITGIGESCFETYSNSTAYSSLKEVVLPNTVTNISVAAFSDDASLSTINLSNVQSVGLAAFSGTGIEKVTFDSEKVEIGQNAFVDCTLLQSVKAKEISSLGESAFQNCSSLGSFEYEGTIVNIPRKVFYATGLTTFRFGGVETIGSMAFRKAALKFGCYDGTREGWYNLVGDNKDYANVSIHCKGDAVEAKDATCTEDGWKEVGICEVCGEHYSYPTDENLIPATGHTWSEDYVVDKEATCTEAGEKSKHCTNCDAKEDVQEIPALGHDFISKVTKKATCTTDGTLTYTCSRCNETKTETIKATGHKWSDWKKTAAATVFKPEVQARKCSACNKSETRNIGKKLAPKATLNASTVTLKVKQSTSGLKVTGLAKGDSVKSWKSSNRKIFTVSGKSNGTCKITGKKSGTAKLQITLASGLKKTVKVKVQTAAVKTSKITVSKNVTVQKGKRVKLKPVVTPFTSSQKVTYTSSNKKIATVSSKGVVTGKKKGTVKITVKSGSKSVKVTVKVK
jgi:hypothetical protein